MRVEVECDDPRSSVPLVLRGAVVPALRSVGETLLPRIDGLPLLSPR